MKPPFGLEQYRTGPTPVSLHVGRTPANGWGLYDTPEAEKTVYVETFV
jgi:hypothetical protein